MLFELCFGLGGEAGEPLRLLHPLAAPERTKKPGVVDLIRRLVTSLEVYNRCPLKFSSGRQVINYRLVWTPNFGDSELETIQKQVVD